MKPAGAGGGQIMSTATTMLGPWDGSVFQQLKEWDPEWAETCFKMSTSPWNSKILSQKLVELIGVGLNAACTNLNADVRQSGLAWSCFLFPLIEPDRQSTRPQNLNAHKGNPRLA